MERDERSLRTCEMVLSAVFGNNNASFASLEYWQEDMQVQFFKSWICTMSNRAGYFPQLCSTFSSNGLIEEIKKLGLAVKCGGLFLALLMFADDIALVAETEEDLLCMLNALHSWCECWLLHTNISKTKVVHFRQKSQPRTS